MILVKMGFLELRSGVLIVLCYCELVSFICLHNIVSYRGIGKLRL